MHWKLPASCWEVWTVPLTEFQQEFLRNCSHRWNVKTGATRSGKTYLDCAVTIPKRICAARDEGLCVMLGNTLGTLERNVLEPMRALWGPELVGVVRTSASGNIVQLFGRKVYVLGADNKKHIARIQGAAFEYAYGDEITTWDEGVLIPMQQIFSYISAHWMEGSIWLLGLGWGYLVKKVTEYKTIKDGLLAIMHDRLYQVCTYYIQQGWIDASGLKNLEYLYQSYHALGGNGTGTELYNRAKALPIRD